MSGNGPICIGHRSPRSSIGIYPLWTYILAAAMHTEEVRIPVEEDVTLTTPRLAPFGARIVAEVFLGPMFADKHSLLSLETNVHPMSNPKYTRKDFVRYALGK